MAVGRVSLGLEERKRISESVARVERECSAEIVPVVVGQSDDYPGARWRMAVAFSILCSFFFYYFLEGVDFIWILLSQFFTLYLGYLLSELRFLKGFFLAEYKKEEEVHQRALEVFWEQGVSNTKSRSGVLIFISLLEHRVKILCDTGIHQKVDQATWEEILERLLNRIRTEGVTEALCGAISECGELIKKHFPPSGDRQNELSDEVVVQDS